MPLLPLRRSLTALAVPVLVLLSTLVVPAGVASAATAPVVRTVSPNRGPVEGGTLVTVAGRGLTGATGVVIGDETVTPSVLSDTSLTFTTPAGDREGSVSVAVVGPGGTSASRPKARFLYTATPPQITAISPKTGPIEGGTTVAVTGSGFTNADIVTVGSKAATFTVNSDSSLSVTTPEASSPGVVDIVVYLTNGSRSAATKLDRFTYVAVPPKISSIAPKRGPVEGGTIVTVTGTGFGDISSVTVGPLMASYTKISDTEIVVTTPPQSTPGAADIRVLLTNGTSSALTSRDQFTYFLTPPTVTGLSPAEGTVLGGTTVTVTGTGFEDVEGLTLGGESVQDYTVDSDTQITLTTPYRGTTGIADLVVFLDNGTQSKITNQSRFTYTAQAPTVTDVSPSSGPVAGGTSVTITGTNFDDVQYVTVGPYLVLPTSASSTSLTINTPAGDAPGTVDIRVYLNSGAVSTINPRDRFTYES